MKFPQVLHDNLWRALEALGWQASDETNYLRAEKLAQDLLEFMGSPAPLSWKPSFEL